jgi:hypothetical protein
MNKFNSRQLQHHTTSAMRSLFTAVLVAATFSFAGAQAPPPPLPGQPLPPSPPPPGRPLPGQPPAPGLQDISNFKGTVVKMQVNDDYVYDGFYLLQNGDSQLVKFPPHLGRQLTAAVKPGTAVEVQGVAATSPAGTREIRFVSLQAGNTRITDTATAPPQPPAEKTTSGSGTITGVRTDREGRINGWVLNGKVLLHVPPHVAAHLSLPAGSAVSYTGREKTAGNGEVQQAGYTVVHCNTLASGGRQYLVQ